MSDSEETGDGSASIEEKDSQNKPQTFWDYFSLALATCGVGYLPLAPGTWGSIVGILIYIGTVEIERWFIDYLIRQNVWWDGVTYWILSTNFILLLLFCLLGIKASKRAAELFNDKDPQKIVVDEVMGQLLVFLFVPFLEAWWLILAGFILFRLFDIWKPYPVKDVEILPNGIGICADDLVAGVYGGVCLSLIYAISLSF